MKKKIERAIKILQMGARDNEVEISYSGGKDSDVILELAKMAGIKYRAIYKNTTIDPPGTIQHCKDMGVEIIRPKKSFFQLVEEKGYPTRFARFCCSELKEYKIMDTAVHGIRRCESSKRAKMYDSKEPIKCRFYGSRENHVNVILPILDWTDKDVEEFVKVRGIKCAPVYYDEDGNFHVERRLGCMGCPLASDNGLWYFKKYPKLARAWIRAGQEYIDAHPHGRVHLYFENSFEMFTKHVFFDSFESFRMAQKGMFGSVDCKAFLEGYFKIKL